MPFADDMCISSTDPFYTTLHTDQTGGQSYILPTGSTYYNSDITQLHRLELYAEGMIDTLKSDVEKYSCRASSTLSG